MIIEEDNSVITFWIRDIQPEDGEFGKLDPIRVMLRNYQPGKGDITITCFGKSWTSYWGGMSDRSIEDFFISSDDAYLAKNLEQGISSTVPIESPDWVELAKREIIKIRMYQSDVGTTMSRDQARKVWDDIVDMEYDFRPDTNREAAALYSKVFGDDWYIDGWPKEDNSDYIYLCRIIRAVRTALKLRREKQRAEKQVTHP